MNEKQFNAKLIKHAQYLHIVSLESCGIQSLPDMFVQVTRGANFWLEGKVKATTASPIPFRPGQEQWAVRMIRRGGLYFVACWLPNPQLIQIYSTNIAIDNGLNCLPSGVVAVDAAGWFDAVERLERRLLALLKLRLPRVKIPA